MTLTSTLGSPGIEIREIDNSIRMNTSTATTVFVPGFANQGPIEEVISIGSISDFELIYGTPTNAAERYFYYTVKSIIDNSGSGVTVLTSRLPYGHDSGDTVSNAYTLLAYPAIPVKKKIHELSNPILNSDKYFSTNQQKNEDTGITYSILSKNLDIFNGSKIVKIEAGKGAEFTTIIASIGEGDETNTLENITYQLIGTTGAMKKENEENAFTTTCIYKITCTDALYDENNDTKVEIIVKIEDVECNENGSPTDTHTTPCFQFEIKENYTLSQDDIQQTTVEGEVDSDCLTFTSKDGFSSIFKANNSQNFINIEESKYEIFVNGSINPNNIVMSFAGGGHDVDLSILSSDVKAPNLSLSINGSETLELTGKLRVESAENKKIINLTYQSNENPKIIAMFKLVYDNIESANFNFAGGSADMTFLEAYEIMEEGYTSSDNTSSDFVEKNKKITYVVGAPTLFNISLKDYYDIITGEFFSWENEWNNNAKTIKECLASSAFIVLNTSRSTINDSYEGFYIGITDNMFNTPSKDYSFNAITSIKVVTDRTNDNNNDQGDQEGFVDDENGIFTEISEERLTFKLCNNDQTSLSKVISRDITSKDISGTDYDDTLNLGLFKLTKTTTSNDTLKLGYSIREKYNWSFSKSRMKSVESSSKPVSNFAENVMENSNNISIFVNPNIASRDFIGVNGTFNGKIRVFGDKLIEGIKTYEDMYLNKVYTPTGNVFTKPAHKLAQSNVNSYKSIIKQAGVTSSILSKIKEKKSLNVNNSIYPFGTYSSIKTGERDKVIGEVPAKLRRALELVENDEQYPDVDILVEGGLGTIYMYTKNETINDGSQNNSSIWGENTRNGVLSGENSELPSVFDENIILQGIEDMRSSRSSLSDDAESALQNYLAVTNTFTKFANSMQNGGRGDTFFISDVPRGILIKGKDTKVSKIFGMPIENSSYDNDAKVVHSFPTSIYYPIKHQFDTVVSTYMSTYAQWVKILDEYSTQKVWIPISGYIAANMAATDGTYGPWYAAAGLRRGVINGVLDYAISPTISQRTDLYKICINSVPKIPNYGVTIWGIRTMGKKDSAFDQNTCRRTFLYMEKKIKQLMRYYIFEPNTSYTRLQIFNDIDPFLEGIKNNGGIYSYSLVCDNTVNTPEIINNGDLVVAIAAAPTRTAENIIIEFTANKYSEEVTASQSMS